VTTTLAQELNALVVFGEHRYFGKSFPTQFSKTDAFKPDNVKYLTVEQVLADYNDLLKQVKYTYKANNSAVIAFGGSYGGMLAGWMRQHFPQTIQGAVAASAPSLYFDGVTPEEAFYTTTTKTFSDGGTVPGHCSAVIKAANDALAWVKAKPTTAGQIVTPLNLCTNKGTPATADDVQNVYDHFSSALQYMAMTDYPEAANFLQPMPAYPVSYACKLIDNVSATVAPNTTGTLNADQIRVLGALNTVASVYFNYNNVPGYCADWKVTDATGNLGDGQGWNALACNQVVLPMSSDGTGMFWNQGKFDKVAYNAQCQKDFGLTPQYDWALKFFGGRNVNVEWKDMTNIVWSNGTLDPWSAGGVTKNVPGWKRGDDWATEAIFITGAAHHTDMRLPSDKDPQSLRDARDKERKHIAKWIAEYKAANAFTPL